MGWQDLLDLVGKTISLKERRLLGLNRPQYWPDTVLYSHTMFIKELCGQQWVYLRCDIIQNNYKAVGTNRLQ
jgi:hypothetical protein